jgi:hypothetical protein
MLVKMGRHPIFPLIGILYFIVNRIRGHIVGILQAKGNVPLLYLVGVCSNIFAARTRRGPRLTLYAIFLSTISGGIFTPTVLTDLRSIDQGYPFSFAIISIVAPLG